MPMQQINCHVRFVCPAFLGDARQRGAWRTPPFKAAIRQWWRIVQAADGIDYPQIREREAALFGNASDKQARQSRVRLRLSKWTVGRMGEAAPVGRIDNGKAQVDAGLYLGYGNIAYDKLTKGVRLEHEYAINADEQAELRIGIVPYREQDQHAFDEEVRSLRHTLALMGRYATIGGRSRNAWGSFTLESDDIGKPDTDAVLIDWQKALAHSWPRGIGEDGKGALIWRLHPGYTDWKKALRELGQIRSELNRHFGRVDTRGLLSHPVTKKTPTGWKNGDRVPNSLRFKIAPEGDKLHGLIFHMPCRPSDDLWQRHPFHDKPEQHSALWEEVHNLLDRDNKLERVSA